MMTPEQRFIFDVQGYIIIPGVLAPERVQRMVADMEEHGVGEVENGWSKARFHSFLSWGEEWRALIDVPIILPILFELLGPRFRLDHAYGMAMRADEKDEGEGLHHHAGMFYHGSYYVTHGEKMHNGLVVVSYALTDIEPGMGGFACIPGSHKALYPVPDGWFQLEGNPMVQQIPQKAGDVLIFTESLTHGTMPWRDKHHDRRSVLMKFCPHYMQWSKWKMPTEIEGLTERQKLILQEPYVADREKVEE